MIARPSFKEFMLHYEAAAEKGEVIAFGTGKRAEHCLEFMEPEHIGFFSDNNHKKWGETFMGRKIIPPEKLMEITNPTVIVMSMFHKQITEQLLGMGVVNVYNDDVVRFMLFNKNEDKIKTVRSFMSDEKSLRVFDGFLNRFKNGANGNKDFIEKEYKQYFAKEVFNFSDEEVFIDGGDALRFAEMLGGKFKRIYCFEPENRNIKNYITPAIQKSDLREKIEIFPYALSDKESILSFDEGSVSNASKIDKAGSAKVRAVDLDSFIKEKVTFIKLDVEGAEMDALKGARSIITGQKPKLAICVYHKFDDLWNIPLYIKSLVPEYNVYMRDYQDSEYEKTMLFTV